MKAPLVCLAAHDRRPRRWTSANVKLLLPPRQSRGVLSLTLAATTADVAARSTASTQQNNPEPEPPSLRLAAPKMGGWLAWIARSKGDVAPAIPPIRPPNDAPGAIGRAAIYDADEYNWAGFGCPFCGASSFVACAGGHLACDGTAELRNGQRFHRCFCGSAGFIQGTMRTVESKRLSVEAELHGPNSPAASNQELRSRSADMALPPVKGGPLSRR
jgi:hypothetical protein